MFGVRERARAALGKRLVALLLLRNDEGFRAPIPKNLVGYLEVPMKVGIPLYPPVYSQTIEF